MGCLRLFDHGKTKSDDMSICSQVEIVKCGQWPWTERPPKTVFHVAECEVDSVRYRASIGSSGMFSCFFGRQAAHFRHSLCPFRGCRPRPRWAYFGVLKWTFPPCSYRANCFSSSRGSIPYTDPSTSSRGLWTLLPPTPNTFSEGILGGLGIWVYDRSMPSISM